MCIMIRVQLSTSVVVWLARWTDWWFESESIIEFIKKRHKTLKMKSIKNGWILHLGEVSLECICSSKAPHWTGATEASNAFQLFTWYQFIRISYPANEKNSLVVLLPNFKIRSEQNSKKRILFSNVKITRHRKYLHSKLAHINHDPYLHSAARK